MKLKLEEYEKLELERLLGGANSNALRLLAVKVFEENEITLVLEEDED